MSKAVFTIEHGAVVWLTAAGPIRLSDEMAEGLLDIFQDADEPAAVRLFNELHDQHVANGGMLRVGSWRAA